MVGSHLIDYLLDKEPDWKLVLFVRWQEDLRNLEHVFEFIEAGERIELVYGDLRDANSLVEV